MCPLNKGIFEKYKTLLQERCDKIKLLDLREDSIRYDFFIALSETEKLKPSDLQIEYAIHESAFKERNNKNSKRKEKPLIDLVVENSKLHLNFEFGLFRQNSNEDGNINKTHRTVKMLNDMIRLALDSHFTKRDAFFICVADDKMLGHQLRSKLLGAFPSDYQINEELVEKQKKTKTKNFDERFLSTFYALNFEINSKIVFNEIIKAKKINRETRVIVWNVTSKFQN